MPKNTRKILVGILVFSGVFASYCSATTLSYTGNLRTDANVTSCGPSCTLGPANTDGEYAQYAAVVVPFTVTGTSSMTAITLSYGGGVNAAGKSVAQSGFEPYLSLFRSDGAFLASTLGANCPATAHANSATGSCYDVQLNGGALAAGVYSLAISAYENMSFAENLGGTLADGFTGLGNLFAGEDLHYAFDINLTPASPAPEPASGLLLSSAVAAWTAAQQLRFRRKR